MCIGVPMQVVSCVGLTALCRSKEGEHRIDMSLVGSQPVGTWILVFLEAAREVITEQRAEEVAKALKALRSVMNGSGEQLDELFADLTEREPQLPEHLRNQ